MSHLPDDPTPATGPGAAAGALAGRTAVVTGASSGIGLAISRSFAREGCRLLLVARREGPLREAARALGADAATADVAREEEVRRVVSRAEAVFGGVPDIVVSAAGAFELAAVHETSPESFDRMVAVNLRAPFLLARAFLPGMLRRGRGHLVTVGSIAGRIGFAHNGGYAASKFGVRGLHAVLDAELRGSGVRSTLVEAAATDTPLWDGVDPSAHPGLPPRSAMLPVGSVAEAVVFAVTRPPEVDVRTLLLERT